MANVNENNVLAKGGETVIQEIPMEIVPMALINLKDTLQIEDNDFEHFKVIEMKPMTHMCVDTYLFKIDFRFTHENLVGLSSKIKLLGLFIKDYELNIQSINFDTADYQFNDDTYYAADGTFEIILKL